VNLNLTGTKVEVKPADIIAAVKQMKKN